MASLHDLGVGAFSTISTGLGTAGRANASETYANEVGNHGGLTCAELARDYLNHWANCIQAGLQLTECDLDPNCRDSDLRDEFREALAAEQAERDDAAGEWFTKGCWKNRVATPGGMT